MNRKLIKLLTSFIPNKKLRHEIREKNKIKELEKELKLLEQEESRIYLNFIEENYPKVLTTTETLKKIIEEKKSICRYGDGEYSLCSDKIKSDNIFQKKDQFLKKRLKEILVSKDRNIIVCIPPFDDKYYEDPEVKNNLVNPKYWKRYWYKNGKIVIKLLDKNKIYGNALLSRITGFYENDIKELKKIWENREIVFVYSKEGRFEKDKRIFDNILSSEEVLIPALNAFERYDEILEECLSKEKNKLFLISAGPTATILAYDLSKKGYQALDIGHLPNSYREFLGEILCPEDLPKLKNKM